MNLDNVPATIHKMLLHTIRCEFSTYVSWRKALKYQTP